jgi:hypothetical protein
MSENNETVKVVVSIRQTFNATNSNNCYDFLGLEALRPKSLRLLDVSCLYSPSCRERLSEKGTSNSPSEDLAAIRSAKWTEKPLPGGPLGSAGSVSETFRTVSEPAFSEIQKA